MGGCWELVNVERDERKTPNTYQGGRMMEKGTRGMEVGNRTFACLQTIEHHVSIQQQGFPSSAAVGME